MKTPLLNQARALLVAAVLPLLAFAASESPSLLLQKGIYAEEIERNLDSAIKIYEQISAESSSSRAVVAQAQYRLAVCYQKQGKKEQAISTLNDLLKQFPSDAALANKTRATLTELGVTPPEAVSVRKIPLPVSTDWIMSISLDGRFVTYTPKGSYDTAVCEVATGKTWTIKGTKESSSWGATQVSPDGQWIAYQNSGTTITIAKIDGSETRKLHEADEKKVSLWLEGWAPDSKHVIVESYDVTARSSRSLSDSFVIFALDAKTGTKKEIVRVARVERNAVGYTLLSEPGFVWSDEVSADGQYVARRSRTGPRSITLWDLKSGRKETVVEQDAESVFGWFAGDTKLLYSKSRVGGIDLWAIRIKDGKPLGEPELVCSNLGEVRPLGVTRAGTIYGCSSQVLWVMEGFLTRTDPQKYIGANTSVTPNPLAEITGPNNSILDRKFGLSANLPVGWTIRNAARNTKGGGRIDFSVPDAPGSTAGLNYAAEMPETFIKAVGPKPATPAEVDAWLRRFAAFGVERRITSYPDYKNRSASVVLRTIGGHKAITWSADFTDNNENWIEHVTYIYSENASVQFSLQILVEKSDAVRPAFDGMIETLRAP